jgi:hypothetical protein
LFTVLDAVPALRRADKVVPFFQVLLVVDTAIVPEETSDSSFRSTHMVSYYYDTVMLGETSDSSQPNVQLSWTNRVPAPF